MHKAYIKLGLNKIKIKKINMIMYCQLLIFI